MDEEIDQYHSYLLRLWAVKVNNHTVWRASLESSSTGMRWGFADLSALCTFLHQHVVTESEAETDIGGNE